MHILGKHGLRRSIAAAGAGNQVGGGLAAGHADQRGGRSVLFKTAALAAGAGQTVAVGDDMPQFRGQPGGAAPTLPIDDNAPANAGTQGEQNTCLYILQCTGTDVYKRQAPSSAADSFSAGSTPVIAARNMIML